MKLEEIAEKTLQCKNEDELINIYQAFMRGEGFENFAISSFTDAGPEIIAGEVPNGWKEYYMQQEYWKLDPVFHAQAIKWDAHFWSALVTDQMHKDATEFMKESEDAGLKNGHTVSILHLGKKTNFAMSSRENLDTHTRDNCIAKSFAVSSMFAAQRANIYKKCSRLKLSHRETEVIKWIVAGKTNAQIAEKMSVKNKTVEEFIRRICQKNNLKGKLQISIRAIMDGIV